MYTPPTGVQKWSECKVQDPALLRLPPGRGGRPMHNSNTENKTTILLKFNVLGNATVKIKLNSLNSSKVKGTIQIPVNKNTTKSHAGNLNTTPATC